MTDRNTTLSPHTASAETVVNFPNTTPTQSVLPIAKHAGFTDRLFSAIAAFAQWGVAAIKAKLERHQNRLVATRMLNLDDATLKDLALTRGDIHYVLSAKSELSATEHLRLLSVQRRSLERTQHKRRASYLKELTASCYSKGISEINSKTVA